ESMKINIRMLISCKMMFITTAMTVVPLNGISSLSRTNMTNWQSIGTEFLASWRKCFKTKYNEIERNVILNNNKYKALYIYKLILLRKEKRAISDFLDV